MGRADPKAILDTGYWMPDAAIEYPVSRIQYQAARRRDHHRNGFGLYEVILGVTIFVIGVLALGRSVQNCLNASALSAEDDRVRQILANRMAEIQATPGIPDAAKETKVDRGYGLVKLIQ